MTDETIHPDVSESEQQGQEARAQAAEAGAQQAADDAGEPAKPILNDPASRRERKMAELAEKRREERERDRKAAALMNDPDLTEEEYDSRLRAIQDGSEEEGPPETSDEPAAEQKATPSDPDERGWLTREDGTRVKRLVVNGRQVEMTEEQYDRQVQKALAGDERLRQAAEYERQLRQREQQLIQQAQQSRQQPPSGASSDDFKKAIAEYQDALLEGDPDATEKLYQVFEKGRQSSIPNIEDLVAQVSTRVTEIHAQERHRESVQSAWDKFQSEYAEIVNDDGLIAYADTQIKRLREENPGGDPEFIMMEAGRLTREKLGLSSQKPQPSGDRAERMERKANLKPIPKASGARAPSKAEPKVDMSPAAKIARMRASRVAS